ncbi:hypothetical protein [Rhodococcus sp. APC 3903]|uniref:hypothetical protein n=1 Tax=Rhodococcus sp. APC 3903 TaxID=3035193 RepID=UPI0025B4976A|nr:hypothetical protein [Rhodococcus sp. APC 3903]MDN3460951.1 hypothetical protein [Rhodococcus sp. APC 3903]
MNEDSRPGNALQWAIHYLFTLDWWKSMLIPIAFGAILAVVFMFSALWAFTLIVSWTIVAGTMLAVEWRYTKTLRKTGNESFPL